MVEVSETGAPPGAEPVRWRLLTTHRVEDAAMAWQVVSWYRMRWTIEQFFRTLKRQGLVAARLAVGGQPIGEGLSGILCAGPY